MRARKVQHCKRGAGVLNTLINKLPIELHIPGYNYCGPGTRLEKRLLRGDRGVNKLDEACKQHDIAYSQSKILADLHEADRILAEQASQRLKSSDASIGEKIAALGVKSAMSAKVKLGMGCGSKRMRKALSFKDVVKRARLVLQKSKEKDLKNAARVAFNSVKNIKRQIRKPRIIPIPKSGGLLPLIPLFAGLSVLGALSGGAAGIT